MGVRCATNVLTVCILTVALAGQQAAQAQSREDGNADERPLISEQNVIVCHGSGWLSRDGCLPVEQQDQAHQQHRRREHKACQATGWWRQPQLEPAPTGHGNG